MAFKIVPSAPSSSPSLSPSSPTAAPSGPGLAAKFVSGTRTLISGIWNNKGKIVLLAGAGYLGYDIATTGPVTRGVRTFYTPPYVYTVDSEGNRIISHTVPLSERAMTPQDHWRAGSELAMQADQVEVEWMAALGRGDTTHDREFDDRRARFATDALTHFGFSLGRGDTETWPALVERRYREMDLLNIRSIAFQLWRLNQYEDARAVMRHFFFDSRWQSLSDQDLCNSLDLALRDNMLRYGEFPEADAREFDRRCPEIMATRAPVTD